MNRTDSLDNRHATIGQKAAGIWNAFSTALSFLTILRVPRIASKDFSNPELGRSFCFFPLVGLILGSCCALAAQVLAPRMPSLLVAAVITALMAILTRALHMDGLADLADGAGGGYTRERRLEIMKDSRSGAFGALALVLAVVLKVAAIDPVIQSGEWPHLLLVPALSRFGMVLAAYKSPYARSEGGLGKPFLEHLTFWHVGTASLISISACVVLAPMYGVLYLAIMPLLVALLRAFSRRTLGGITGDVLGAVNEIVEVVLLSVAASIVHA